MGPTELSFSLLALPALLPSNAASTICDADPTEARARSSAADAAVGRAVAAPAVGPAGAARPGPGPTAGGGQHPAAKLAAVGAADRGKHQGALAAAVAALPDLVAPTARPDGCAVEPHGRPAQAPRGVRSPAVADATAALAQWDVRAEPERPPQRAAPCASAPGNVAPAAPDAVWAAAPADTLTEGAAIPALAVGHGASAAPEQAATAAASVAAAMSVRREPARSWTDPARLAATAATARWAPVDEALSRRLQLASCPLEDEEARRAAKAQRADPGAGAGSPPVTYSAAVPRRDRSPPLVAR